MKTIEELDTEIIELIAAKASLKEGGKWNDQKGYTFDNMIDKCCRQRLSRRKKLPIPRHNNTEPKYRNDLIKLKL